MTDRKHRRRHGRSWAILWIGGVLGLSGVYAPVQATPEPEDLAPSEVTVGGGGARLPVRVRMAGRLGGSSLLTLATVGRCRVVDAATGRVVGEWRSGSTWEVAADGGRVRATPVGGGGATVGAATLRFEATAPDGFLRVASGRRTPGNGPDRAFLHLPGALEVTRGRRGLSVVNEAPFEAYILGVVAAEGAASFHHEALKALAIAARSYTERNRRRHQDGAELCDTTHCHVYAGIGGVATSVRAAVEATRGLFALYDGQPIDAVYSADCGGRTQSPDDAWGPRRSLIPYLRSILDAPAEGAAPYCSVNPKHIWRVVLPLETLWSRLGWGGEARHLRQVAVGATNGSGRATRITLIGGVTPPSAADEALPCEAAGAPVALSAVDSAASARRERVAPGGTVSTDAATGARALTRHLSLEQFRELIRPQGLPGAFFRLFVEQDRLIVEGTGSGHGVGLCQYGAQGMALQGHSYEAILKHYYAGIEVGPLPSAVRTTASRE